MPGEMKSTLKNIALKCFLLLMALQILNLGIDSIEFQPLQATAAIGDFNYINSMTEYFSEIVMGHKDAFPEYGQSQTPKPNQNVKHIDIKIYQPQMMDIPVQKPNEATAFAFPVNERYCCCFGQEINPPPPKA